MRSAVPIHSIIILHVVVINLGNNGSPIFALPVVLMTSAGAGLFAVFVPPEHQITIANDALSQEPSELGEVLRIRINGRLVEL